MDLAQRYRGCLLGLAVGDAVGTALEFRRPGNFKPSTDMIGGGSLGLEPGQWTDDTSIALCLAESLIEKKGFDPTDQMQRYVRWWKEGHLSCTGECFDVGNATRAALSRFVQTGQALSGCALSQKENVNQASLDYWLRNETHARIASPETAGQRRFISEWKQED